VTASLTVLSELIIHFIGKIYLAVCALAGGISQSMFARPSIDMNESKEAGRLCGPDCREKHECNKQEGASDYDGGASAPTPATGQARDSTLVKTAHATVLAIFVMGVYAQVFSLCLFAFS